MYGTSGKRWSFTNSYKKVALFGNGARATIKGGTGSGDVNTRNNVNIEQGFQNAGIEVTTTAWLDRQEQNTSAAKAAYVQWMKEEAARKQTSELAVMFDHPYKEPDCEIITINDIDVSETDTASICDCQKFRGRSRPV